jgi:hypothetical protein
LKLASDVVVAQQLQECPHASVIMDTPVALISLALGRRWLPQCFPAGLDVRLRAQMAISLRYGYKGQAEAGLEALGSSRITIVSRLRLLCRRIDIELA